jgi:hypothetical protein
MDMNQQAAAMDAGYESPTPTEVDITKPPAAPRRPPRRLSCQSPEPTTADYIHPPPAPARRNVRPMDTPRPVRSPRGLFIADLQPSPRSGFTRFHPSQTACGRQGPDQAP